MNSLERVKAAIRFEKTDRIPVIPEVAGVTARLLHKSVHDYVTDGELIAQSQLAAQKHFNYDTVIAFADLCIEPEAIGCEVKFPRDNYPHIVKPILNTIEGLSDLSVPDPHKSARMPELIKAVRLMKKKLNGTVPVVGHVLSPMTIASRIMDIEQMLYLIVDHPEDFKKLLSYTLKVSIKFAKALLEAGADSIIMFDPTSSPAILPPRIFREFELPKIKTLFSSINAFNPEAITWYSVAGPTQEIIKDLEGLNLDILTIDYLVSLDVAFELSSTICFNGNIKSLSFSEASPEEIYKTSTTLLESSLERGGFILGAGCEVPPDAKLENIAALTRASVDFSNRYTSYGKEKKGTRCVTFYPSQKKVYIETGANLMDAASMAKLTIPHLCYRAGVCGSCIVQVDDKGREVENLSEKEKILLTPEQKNRKYRLACQTSVSSDMLIYVPRQSRIGYNEKIYRKDYYTMSIFEMLENYRLSTRISAIEIKKSKPGNDDTTPYLDLILSSVGADTRLRPDMLSETSLSLRRKNGALYGIVATSGGHKKLLNLTGSKKVFGVALDLGTTTIAAYIHDLETGQFLGSGSILNPQHQMGNNVMTRAENDITGSGDPEQLRHLAVEGINRVILEITRDAGVDYNNIYNVVAVGNSVMHHSFLGLPLDSLVRSPFIPVMTSKYEFYNNDNKVSERLAVNKNALITCPPILGSFIGSDVTVGALAAGLYNSDKLTLYIDLGTNGEIIIADKNKILASSIAAGPAFEQSHLSGGRIAGANVIYRIDMDDDLNLTCKTMDGGKPTGYCGSALIDVIACFIRHGIINNRGYFIKKKEFINMMDNQYMLVPKQDTAFFEPIIITAKDIEEVQKAKGAVRAAIAVITDKFGATYEQIDQVILTGSFGMNLRVENAVEIGLLPVELKDKVKFVPNAAGAGATLYLLSEKASNEINEYKDRIEYVHAAKDDKFNDLFIDSMLF